MGRHTTGRIFTRTTQSGKTWYLDYTHDGDRRKMKLANPDGTAVTNRAQAEEARRVALAPFMFRDEATRRASALSSLLSAEDAAAAAELEAARLNNRRRLDEAWTLSPYETTEAGNTERALAVDAVKSIKAQWMRFVAWAAGLGLVYLQDVSADHAAQWRRGLLATMSPNSANKALLYCKVMFRRSGVTPNPFDGLKRFADKPTGRRELTFDELKLVCSSASGELRTLLALGLFTGQRLKDSVLLDWGQIDGLNTIRFIPAKTKHCDKEIAVPIHAELVAILAETPPEDRRGHVLPELAAVYQRNASTLVNRIQAHLRKCGLETQSEPDPTTGRRVAIVGFHSLRHSFVSACARRGVPLSAVQELCGHSSRDIQRRYLHVGRDDLTAAIGALPSLNAANDGADNNGAGYRQRLIRLAQSADIAAVKAALDAIDQ